MESDASAPPTPPAPSAAPPASTVQIPASLTAASDVGFSLPALLLLGMALALFVVAGVLRTLAQTISPPSAGLIDTTTWFIWATGTTGAFALVLAGLMASRASAAIRVALILGGAYVIVQVLT